MKQSESKRRGYGLLHEYSIERQLMKILAMEAWAAERASTIYRPVELDTIARLDDGRWHAWEYTIPNQRPAQRKERYCVLCNTKHDVREFSRDKDNHDKLAFACDKAREQIGRKSWRRLYERRAVPKVA